MPQNPTVIAASLDDQELRKSIDSLVQYVKDQTGAMSKAFDNNVQKMEDAIKNLGSKKSGSSNSNVANAHIKGMEDLDKATQKTAKSVEDLGKAYYQALGALQLHQREQKLLDSKKFWTTEDVDRYSRSVQKTIELETSLAKKRADFNLAMAKKAESGAAFDARATHRNLTAVDERLTQLERHYRALQVESQKAFGQDLQRALKMPEKTLDEIRIKIQRLYAVGDQGLRTEFVSQSQLRTLDSALDKLHTMESEQSRLQRQLTQNTQERSNIVREEVALGNVAVTQAQQQVAKTAENLAFHERILRARQEAENIKTRRANNPTDTDYLREQLASLLGVQTKEIQLTNIQKASYNDLARELKTLQAAYNKLGADLVKSEGKDIAQRIRLITKAMQEIKKDASRPASFTEMLGHPEKTLDQINYKMQQLKAYMGGLDWRTQADEVRSCELEYSRLQKKQNELLGQNARLLSSNNTLARSWTYMKNRLAFYVTVGASTSFVRQLAEVRGQYEMTEKALGVLIGSAQRGTQVFHELSEMALISPYTLIELSNAARQLTAYGVEAKDLVDTTRRLADISAAVGAPIENIAYALGHVQSYGYLTSLQARQFANNGIPLVKELSKRYTELEGRVVSVTDVYDRMKKKQVEYNDVMGVLNSMTDEVGRFI